MMIKPVGMSFMPILIDRVNSLIWLAGHVSLCTTHTFNKYLLSTYFVPGIILSTGKIVVKKIDKVTAPMGLAY